MKLLLGVFRTAVVGFLLLIFAPASILADTLYVANDADNTIVKIDSSGNASVFASSGLNHPEGLAFDTSGNLFVANGNGTIEKYDPSGNGSVFASSQLDFPFGPIDAFALAFDSSGDLYAVDTVHERILKFDPQGHASLFVTNSSLLFGAEGIAFDGSGNLYVARNMNNAVVKFDTNGVASVFASPVFTDTNNPPVFNSPTGLAFDNSGSLCVGNDGTGVIMKFDANGNGSLFNSIPTLGDINGLAIGSSGNLYATDYSGNSVVKWDSSGHGTIIADASDGLDGPMFIAVQVSEPSSLLQACAGALLLWPVLKRRRAYVSHAAPTP